MATPSGDGRGLVEGVSVVYAWSTDGFKHHFAIFAVAACHDAVGHNLIRLGIDHPDMFGLRKSISPPPGQANIGRLAGLRNADHGTVVTEGRIPVAVAIVRYTARDSIVF